MNALWRQIGRLKIPNYGVEPPSPLNSRNHIRFSINNCGYASLVQYEESGKDKIDKRKTNVK